MLQRIALLLPFALLIKNAVVSATADPATPAQETAAQKRADDERLEKRYFYDGFDSNDFGDGGFHGSFYHPFEGGYQRGSYGFRSYKRQLSGNSFKYGIYDDKNKKDTSNSDGGKTYSDGYECSSNNGKANTCKGYGKYGRLGGNKKEDEFGFGMSDELDKYFSSGAFDANFAGPEFGGFGRYGGGGFGEGFGGYGNGF
ncbi:hypothetical protein BDV98DRAFT_574877 [Pterulicium gracile]|uniref:Uncharacterized protein n=1 Tax=Pterulicium gracile TaxID=1884261 RepID=A0A5C3Q637_9AGAR|nr:hypothetical protein BDV98DRAFT_574877 [Pterula gracilis]